MDVAVRAWLLAQLGPTTDTSDLDARYARLTSARAVASEVLAERRAKLLADPLRMTVDGVVTIDQSNNLAGLERQITALVDLVAPDELAEGEESTDLVTAPLLRARRGR
ncbi:hypothetical protein PV416_05055 [Streptomyces ipomoeae]|uniref:hypothetical protein n=1 Tax=Streptomyces ipomoeae TaxID=103232 RepID=UPI0029ACDB13|nr:hypothetical protein [Streptomyces ipomoeae]MDX2820468.1 hypothetical protein [Streptomyces ipomoeae]MDX2874822.1 hypothetical protein [Streptomyces ipomoeae]